MARLLGISWQDIRERSKQIVTSDHRGELFNLKNGVTLIDESYNSNPSALKSALSSAMQLDPKRRHVLVLGAMRELEPYHEKYHREVGEALATMLESAPISTVVVGVGGDTSHLLEPIRQRLPKVPTHLLVSVEEAIKIVPNLLEPGDILL